MRPIGLLVASLLLCGVARADQQDRELARSRYATGQALFQRGRWSEALAEFEAAKALMKSPAFDYNVGMCLVRLDRPAEAADALERYINAKPDDPDAASIWRTIAELRTEVARRASKLPPEKIETQLETKPELLPPPAIFQETPPPSAPSVDRRRATHKQAGIATTTIGAVLLVTAAITGGIAKSMRSDYDHGCDQNQCVQDTYWTAHNLAIGTDTLIAVGAAAGIAAIALWAVRGRLPVEVAPSLAPGAASLAIGARF